MKALAALFLIFAIFASASARKNEKNRSSFVFQREGGIEAATNILGCQADGAKQNHVNWFVMLKTPTVSTSKNALVHSGLAYSYADSTSPSLKFNAKSIGNTTSALGKTLESVYSISSSSPNLVGYIA